MTRPKSPENKSRLEVLAKLGDELFEAGRDVAVHFGLIERNPAYKRLPRNTPLQITCQPYVVKRSQDDGEKDLVALANDIPYEGAWFYTPKDSNWYHISTNHKEEFSEKGGFRFSAMQESIHLRIPGDRLIHYHTHPAAAADYLRDYFLTTRRAYTSQDDEWKEQILKVFWSIGTRLHTGFPSPRDMEHYIFLRSTIDEKVYIEGRIASPFGITVVEIQDPSERTSSLYKERHGGVYERIIEDEIIQVDASKNETIQMRVHAEKIFDFLNKEMDGRMKLTFNLVDSSYFQRCL